MWKTGAVAAILVASLPAGARAQDAKTVIADASTVMGVTAMNAITYSGAAAQTPGS